MLPYLCDVGTDTAIAFRHERIQKRDFSQVVFLIDGYG